MLLLNIKNTQLGAGQALLLFTLLCNAVVSALPTTAETQGLKRHISEADALAACEARGAKVCEEAGAAGDNMGYMFD